MNKAHILAERLRAGTVWVNCDVFDAAAPLAGFKQSGLSELGQRGLDAYLEDKTVTVRLG